MGVTVNHWLAEFDSQMRSHNYVNYSPDQISGLRVSKIRGY